MPRTTYSDVNVFYRAVRVLPVIAIAALIGGLIGGFSIYAIDAALNWDARGGRPDIRAAATTELQATQPQPTQPQPTQQQQGQSPVRSVEGAIPDPSAGMSGPPPVQQPAVTPAATQQAAAPAQPPAPAQNSTQLSPQLLTPQPLGPASQFQHATGEPAQTQPQPQPQAQPQPQPAAQPASATAQQPNMQQTPKANAPTPRSANSDNGAVRKTDSDARTAATSTAATSTAATSGEGGAGTARHARHARQRRRYDARAYDRYYDSYGRPSYGTPSYGTPRGIVRQPQDADRMPRPEPFWGGGFFRGDRFGGYSGD